MISKITNILNVLYWIMLRREIIVPTFGTYGDLLMTNGVLKQYSEQQKRKLYIICKNDTLIYNLPFIEKYIANYSAYYFATWMAKWFKNIKIVNYGPINNNPNLHLMQRIANALSFKLEAGFKPFYNIDLGADSILFDFKSDLPIICIQSEPNTIFCQNNKNWIPERIDEVVTYLNNKEVITIQIGTGNDRKLDTHYHYHGKLTMRQSIYLLSKSNLFIGTEGALMHACSAINTKAVIIFGGYIHPHQSGYDNIIGLKSDVECAPCLLTTACPFNMKCMNQIGVNEVLIQVTQFLQSKNN